MPCLMRHVGIGARVDEEQLADVPLAMNAFSPLRIHSSPLRSALSRQPAFGVVRRQAVVRTGVRLGDALAHDEGVIGEERLEEALFLFLGADRGDQMAPFPVLAESLRDRAVALRELGHHQRLRHEIGAVAAPLFRHRQRAKAELRALLDDVPVPRSRPRSWIRSRSSEIGRRSLLRQICAPPSASARCSSVSEKSMRTPSASANDE